MPSPSTDGTAAPESTVGVVGVGRVGRWFVTKLTRAGYGTVACDVDPEAVAAAVETGADAAADPATLTRRADVIVLSLPTRGAVEAVMEGPDGVLDALGEDQTVVDTGTTPPDVAVHYERVCRDRGAAYVDCGITRHGPGEGDRPDEPAYTLLVGGRRAAYERVRPVLATLGHTHEFFEGVGQGHVVKAGVALRAVCRAAVAAETCQFLDDNGVDPERVATLLDWELPAPYFDPPYPTARGFDRATSPGERSSDTGDGGGTPDSTEDGDGGRDAPGPEAGTRAPGPRIDDDGARPRLAPSPWLKDPSTALAVAHAAGSHVPMLSAAHQSAVLAANLGAALTDRELAFNDDEWRLFHLRSVYRALSNPGAEWRRLDRWAESGE